MVQVQLATLTSLLIKIGDINKFSIKETVTKDNNIFEISYNGVIVLSENIDISSPDESFSRLEKSLLRLISNGLVFIGSKKDKGQIKKTVAKW